MAKSKKLVICLGVALLIMLCSASLAFADAIYIGNVGFDMDQMLNDEAYKASFNQYFAAHTDDPFLVDMAGMTFDIGGYLNSPEGTSLAQYAQQNPTTIPGDAVVWDGTGEPGAGTDEVYVISIE